MLCRTEETYFIELMFIIVGRRDIFNGKASTSTYIVDLTVMPVGRTEKLASLDHENLPENGLYCVRMTVYQ